jgi:hypothetical protein
VWEQRDKQYIYLDDKYHSNLDLFVNTIIIFEETCFVHKIED